MFKKRKFFQLAGVAAVAALALTACSSPSSTANDPGGDSSNKVVNLTFTWWGDSTRAAITTKAIAQFNKKYPNIHVTDTFADWNSYWQKASTQAAGGGLPDIMQMDISYVRQYGQQNALLDLTPYVGKNKEIDVSGYNPALLPSGKLNGKYYGLPTSTTEPSFFFNPAVLKATGIALPKSGMTWSDYDDFLRSVTKAGKGTYYGGDDYTSSFKLFTMWLLQHGKQAFDSSGKLGFTKTDLTKWWSSVSDLRKDGVFYPQSKAEQVAPLAPLQTGQSASGFALSNFLTSYAASVKQPTLDLLPIPTDNPKKSGMYINASMLLSGSAKTKYPKQVATFINFWVNNGAVSQLFGTTRGMPATKSATAGTTFTGSDKDVLAYQTAIAKTIAPSGAPPVIGFGTLETDFINDTHDIDFGKSTVAQAVDLWFSQAQTVQQQ